MISLVSCWGPQKPECSVSVLSAVRLQALQQYIGQYISTSRTRWNVSRRAVRSDPSPAPGFPRAASSRSLVRASLSCTVCPKSWGWGQVRYEEGRSRPLTRLSSHLSSLLGTLTQQRLGWTLPQVLQTTGQDWRGGGCWVSAGMEVGSARVHDGAVFQVLGPHFRGCA